MFNIQADRRGSRKFCQSGGRGSKHLDFFLLWSSYFKGGESGLYQYSKWVTIGPPAKRHFNGRPKMALIDGMIFQGFQTCPNTLHG